MTTPPPAPPRGGRLHSTTRDGFELEVDEATSIRMAGIRQFGTSPELIVRKLVRALGARYRVSNKDLPGSPDLANRSKRWAIFVHGCYWHRHPECKLTTTPKRNREFWEAKFARNVARDLEAVHRLEELGFAVLVIWECETRTPETLLRRLRRWSHLAPQT